MGASGTVIVGTTGMTGDNGPAGAATPAAPAASPMGAIGATTAGPPAKICDTTGERLAIPDGTTAVAAGITG